MTETGKTEGAYKAKSLVMVKNYSASGAEVAPTLAFVVREATWQDKVDFVLRMRKRGFAYEMDKKSLKNYFKSTIYICMEGEEIGVIAGEAIIREVSNPEEVDAMKVSAATTTKQEKGA